MRDMYIGSEKVVELAYLRGKSKERVCAIGKELT